MTAMLGSKESQALSGQRILVVEDDYLVASWLSGVLRQWGCEVVGPAPTVQEGLRLAEKGEIEGAILDINLRGEHSGPVAEALEAKGLPFFFLTGYGSPALLPERLRQRQKLFKPVKASELRAAVQGRFGPKD
ncbi:MAG: response regulator [Phycisphaerales bacterium]|nr:response regulator [Phycisphaerales bacterium]